MEKTLKIIDLFRQTAKGEMSDSDNDYSYTPEVLIDLLNTIEKHLIIDLKAINERNANQSAIDTQDIRNFHQMD